MMLFYTSFTPADQAYYEAQKKLHNQAMKKYRPKYLLKRKTERLKTKKLNA